MKLYHQRQGTLAHRVQAQRSMCRHRSTLTGHLREFVELPSSWPLRVVGAYNYAKFREFQAGIPQVLRLEELASLDCLLLRQDRCLLMRQDRCLLLRQDRCLLLMLRQDRCLLLMLRQMSSAARTDICLVSSHTVDVPEISIVAMSQCSSRR